MRLGQLKVEWRSQAAMKSGIFPSGRKQPQLEMPAFIVAVTVQQTQDPEILDRISQCIKGGASSVLLTEDAGRAPCSAGELYDAAVQLQEMLRDRAKLFITGRSDIAEAVNAKGIVLTDQSVPFAVARRMLKQKSVLLGRQVKTPEEAQKEASNGASFILMQQTGDRVQLSDIQKAKEMQRGGRVPIVPLIESVRSQTGSEVQNFLTSDLDGICVGVNIVRELGVICGNEDLSNSELAAEAVMKFLTSEVRASTPNAAPSQVSLGS